MIKISLDEAYVFDLLSIYEVKMEKSSESKFQLNNENFKRLSKEIIKQIGRHHFDFIMLSEEYKKLKSSNKLVFELVERANESELSLITANANYERYINKISLQNKFFNTNLTEIKFSNTTKSYYQSGRLGDLLHSLIVCKYNYDKFGIKANLYISDSIERFNKGVEFTCNDLKPVLEKQEWFNDLKVHEGEHIDIDLSKFRGSEYLYKSNWHEIYFNEFCNGDKIPQNYSWIELEKELDLGNTVLINRSSSFDPSQNEKLGSEIDKLVGFDIAFICFDENQYDTFAFKDKCRLIKVDSMYDFFVKINSCKLYIGNLSAPTVMATALNVSRLIELAQGGHLILDNAHYETYKQYYDNLEFIK